MINENIMHSAFVTTVCSFFLVLRPSIGVYAEAKSRGYSSLDGVRGAIALKPQLADC